MRASLSALSLAVALGGCAPAPDSGVVIVAGYGDAGPSGAAPGTCWGRSITPAVIETVTRQRRQHDGAAAAYTTDTRQRIVRPRRESWFRAQCPDAMTREFIESLQRALVARGHRAGPVTGRMNAPTRKAIRAYQSDEIGLDSATLSREAAQRLGLVVVDNPRG